MERKETRGTKLELTHLPLPLGFLLSPSPSLEKELEALQKDAKQYLDAMRGQ